MGPSGIDSRASSVRRRWLKMSKAKASPRATPDLAHIPFVLRAPGVPAVRRSEPVSHLDVMPTQLEAAGLPVPEGLRASRSGLL